MGLGSRSRLLGWSLLGAGRVVAWLLYTSCNAVSLGSVPPVSHLQLGLQWLSNTVHLDRPCVLWLAKVASDPVTHAGDFGALFRTVLCCRATVGLCGWPGHCPSSGTSGSAPQAVGSL